MTDRRGAPQNAAERRRTAQNGAIWARSGPDRAAIPAAARPDCRPSDSPKTLKENPSFRFREKEYTDPAMERVLELLQARRWRGTQLRTNVVPPEAVVYKGGRAVWIKKRIKSDTILENDPLWAALV